MSVGAHRRLWGTECGDAHTNTANVEEQDGWIAFSRHAQVTIAYLGGNYGIESRIKVCFV